MDDDRVACATTAGIPMTLPDPAAIGTPSHPATPGGRIAHRICPLCEACCGLELTVAAADPERGVGERVVAIRGDAQDIFSRGYLCPKAVALKDLEDDPDRLRQPWIRRAGRLEPATWEEAFAEIGRRLPPIVAAHGRDALAFTLGNPNVHRLG